MWVIHEWEDISLRWNPLEYGGVAFLYVPSESIWLPDIVLYNNADGDYTVTMMTKATLTYYGKVIWEPPAIYKSHCDINVEFFPFDEQSCMLKFGTWTFDGLQVDLKHIDTDKLGLGDTEEIERGIDLNQYYRAVEWDLMRVTAKKTNNYYPCCQEPFPDITFRLKLRRKTLFYTVNLMIPCISINLLTILLFYLPSDSGEKISLCVSLLLSLSVFQLLLMELVPATSITVPLLGKYIIFTMILVAMSVFISVVTLNVNYRSSSTQKLPELTRKIFLTALPKLLLMRRPNVGDSTNESTNPRDDRTRNGISDSMVESAYDNLNGDYNVLSTFIGSNHVYSNSPQQVDTRSFCDACKNRGGGRYPLHIQKAFDGSQLIVQHLKDEDEGNRDKANWQYLALVLDRLFLWIYSAVSIIGTLGILLHSPVLFDYSKPLEIPDHTVT